MANKQISSSQPSELLKTLPVYGFAFLVLTLVWLLTGVGYFWPIWFMIGWISGSHATDFFQKMYNASRKQWCALQNQIVAPEQKAPKKSSSGKSKSPQSDDTDIAGA